MSELRADVMKMSRSEGLYVALDPIHPDAIVPIVSKEGKLWSMRVDAELSPTRFLERCELHGPFWPSESNLISRAEREPASPASDT